jgi:hypothetical protein
MLEVLKIITDYMTYLKLCDVTQNEKRMIYILELCKPQKTDDIEMIANYFDTIVNLFRNERLLPVFFNKDFYFEYCKLYLNEDYQKIEIVHSMLECYNKFVKSKMQIDNDLDKYYHDTGMFLMANKKLINYDVFKFLKKDPYFEQKENIIPIDLISEGIVFEDNNKKFYNEFLNNRIEDFDLREFFGNYYYDFMRIVFDRFKTPRDVVSIRYWDINYSVDKEVLENFIYAIKRVWLGDTKNAMYGIEKLIAKALGKASLIMGNFLQIINDLEKSISSNLIMPIYTELLYRNFHLKEDFKEHIIFYINCNCGKNAIDIWYFVNTLEDQDKKNEYLMKNLKDEFAVKAEDFINYPAITDGKITLFAHLYNGRYFLNYVNLTQLSYYKLSCKSKDNIYNIKYIYAMNVYKNLEKFTNLFLFFLKDIIEKKMFLL